MSLLPSEETVLVLGMSPSPGCADRPAILPRSSRGDGKALDGPREAPRLGQHLRLSLLSSCSFLLQPPRLPAPERAVARRLSPGPWPFPVLRSTAHPAGSQ